MPREIVYHSDIAQARFLGQFCDRRSLPRSDLKNQLAIFRKMRRGFRRDPAQDIQAIRSRAQSDDRLVVANLGFQRRNLRVPQIQEDWRLLNRKIEGARPCPEYRNNRRVGPI